MQFKTKILSLFVCCFFTTNLWANNLDGFDDPINPACDYNFDIQGNYQEEICYDSRNTFTYGFTLENSGSDTLQNVTFDWYVNAGLHGNFQLTDPIAPNATAQLTLPQVSFVSEGTFTIMLSATGFCGVNPIYTDSVTIDVIVRSKLVVNELSDTSICSTDQLWLRGKSGFSSYEWSNGLVSKDILVDSAGIYAVTVTDYIGCSTTDSMGLDIYSLSEDLLGNDTVVCDGVILTTGVVLGLESYLWTGGFTSSNIDISLPGTYVVNVSDSFGCSYADSMKVSYATVPQPGAPDLINLCQGDTAIVNAASNFNSYLWNTGDTSSQILVATPGLYYLTVTGNYGCVGLDTIMINVQQLPDVAFNDSVMCNNTSFVLDAGQWFPKILWSTGDTVQDLLVSQPGMYSVQVEDLNGCKMTDSVMVKNIDVVVSLGPDEEICEGTPFFLIPQGMFDTYSWIDGTSNPSFSVTASGTYSVTVTNGVCSNSDEVDILVVPAPIADFNYQITSPTVVFTNYSNQTTNLMWYFGDGDSSNIVHPTHTYASSGIYPVKLAVTNVCGTDEFSIDLNIYPQGSHSIYLNENLKVFPTLAESNIHFSIEGLTTSTIEYMVYDAVGKLLYVAKDQYLDNGYLYTVDVSRFASGTYYLKICDAEQSALAVQPFVRK